MNQNSEINTFAFGDHLIRTVEHQGTPWFLASDVCAVLELGNVSQAINGNSKSGAHGLDEDESAITNLDIRSENGVSQTREVLIVSEPGLYRLAFKSRKQEAKVFQKWVFSEVLPAIRRTGSYSPRTRAVLGFLRELLAMGIPAAAAARLAQNEFPALSPRERQQALRSGVLSPLADLRTPQEEEDLLVLSLMQPGKEYVVADFLGLFPKGHRLAKLKGSAFAATLGKILTRLKQDGRLGRLHNTRHATYHLPSEITPISAGQS